VAGWPSEKGRRLSVSGGKWRLCRLRQKCALARSPLSRNVHCAQCAHSLPSAPVSGSLVLSAMRASGSVRPKAAQWQSVARSLASLPTSLPPALSPPRRTHRHSLAPESQQRVPRRRFSSQLSSSDQRLNGSHTLRSSDSLSLSLCLPLALSLCLLGRPQTQIHSVRHTLLLDAARSLAKSALLRSLSLQV